MFKIIATQPLHEQAVSILKEKCILKVVESVEPKEFIDELKDADAIIIRLGHMDGEDIMSAKKLRVIAKAGVGVDGIDLKYAAGRGIPVVYAPGVNTVSVAEHAFGMIVALAKDFMYFDKNLREKEFFEVRKNSKAFELSGKTAGIIGFGGIGREIARFCSCFNMHVCVYDPFADREIIRQQGFQHAPRLEDLIAASDIISVHVPLTEQTRNLIGENEFNMMKRNAIFINCSRGDIVDEQALINALLNNRIKGAGIDVFTKEPIERDNPLLKLDNVIVTPHVAGVHEEILRKSNTRVALGVLATLEGKRWDDVANKEVYNHEIWKGVLGE